MVQLNQGHVLCLVMLVVIINIPIVCGQNQMNNSAYGNSQDVSPVFISRTISGTVASTNISEATIQSTPPSLFRTVSLEGQQSSGTNIPGIEWQHLIGGNAGDSFFDIQQTSDGGYVAAGGTGSWNGDVPQTWNGSLDGWVVKTDSGGQIIWQTRLGGSGYDQWMSIQQTSDAGYIVAGFSNSTDGEFKGLNHGNQDGLDCKTGF